MAPRSVFCPWQRACLGATLLLVAGSCGSKIEPRTPPSSGPGSSAAPAKTAANTATPSPTNRPATTSGNLADGKPVPSRPTGNFPGTRPQGSRPQDQGPQDLSDLLFNEDGTERVLPPSEGSSAGAELALARLDEPKLAAAGIRMLKSKHLVLVTDLPSDPTVDELPAVFDLAVPQWRSYFNVPAAQAERWKMIAYLIKDKERFRAQDLFPDTLPAFQNGYQLGNECWVYEQASPYYRRHLLLHEGTHGFMMLILGGGGPPWYMEGMAELLGTHHWADGKLTLHYMPRSSDEVPYWGRVKLIKDQFAAGQGLALTEILQFGPRAHLEVEPYAWCWGASVFFDNHPRYQQTFRALQRHVKLDTLAFSERFYQALKNQWPQVTVEWQLFIVNCEYGYDVPRSAIDFLPGQPLPAEGKRLDIAADRSWQSSGVRLEAGQSYQIDARGQYVVATDPKPWTCQPGGVTIRYYKGQPLGIVQAAVLDESAIAPQTVTPLARPLAIGLGRALRPETSGTLYLRINDSAAELADNSGQVAIRILPSSATD